MKSVLTKSFLLRAVAAALVAAAAPAAMSQVLTCPPRAARSRGCHDSANAFRDLRNINYFFQCYQ